MSDFRMPDNTGFRDPGLRPFPERVDGFNTYRHLFGVLGREISGG